MNPVAMMRQQRAEDFQRLVKENEALALRLKTLEEAGSSCGDAELLKTAEKIHEQSNKELTSESLLLKRWTTFRNKFLSNTSVFVKCSRHALTYSSTILD